jgi:hypothetical protein
MKSLPFTNRSVKKKKHHKLFPHLLSWRPKPTRLVAFLFFHCEVIAFTGGEGEHAASAFYNLGIVCDDLAGNAVHEIGSVGCGGRSCRNWLEAAIGHYSAALALQPDWEHAHHNLSLTTMKLKKHLEGSVPLNHALLGVVVGEENVVEQKSPVSSSNERRSKTLNDPQSGLLRFDGGGHDDGASISTGSDDSTSEEDEELPTSFQGIFLLLLQTGASLYIFLHSHFRVLNRRAPDALGHWAPKMKKVTRTKAVVFAPGLLTLLTHRCLGDPVRAHRLVGARLLLKQITLNGGIWTT